MLTILINLDAAIERRRRMEARLAAVGITPSRIGVDLREAATGDVQRWFASNAPNLRLVPQSICSAEAGCWASHVLAWRRLLESDERICTVLEDDLVLAPGFRQAITAVERGTQDFDLLYLGTSSRNISSRRRTRIGDVWAHEPLGVIFNTWGYVVSRAYAERFFAAPSIRIDMPVDHFLGGRAKVAKPRIAVLRPPVVAEDPAAGLASQIQPYATRMDRHPWWMALRRAILASRVSDLYYSLYRWL